MQTNPVKAIREKCLDCCCGSSKEVSACALEDCSLHPFRYGKNPYRAKREISEAQRAACKVNCKTNSKVNSKTNVNEADKELDKEIEEENNHCASQPSPAAVNAFFESVWALYPIKRGAFGPLSQKNRR